MLRLRQRAPAIIPAKAHLPCEHAHKEPVARRQLIRMSGSFQLIGRPAANREQEGLFAGAFHAQRMTLTLQCGEADIRAQAIFLWAEVGDVQLLYRDTVKAELRGGMTVAVVFQRAAAQKGGAKLSASYAMPFPLGDFHIGNLFYVTRGIITPHFDWSFIGSGQLFSAGATLEMEFGNFFGLAFPARLGVTYSYNGGPTFSSLKNAGIDPGRHTVGPVFSMDF